MKNFTVLAAILFSLSSFAANERVDICHESAPGYFIDLSVSIKSQAAFARQGDFIGTCLYKELLETCDAGVNETRDACLEVQGEEPPPPPVDGGDGSGGGGDLPEEDVSTCDMSDYTCNGTP